MLLSLTRTALIGLIGVLASPAYAQLITHRDLSYAIAKTIAEATVASCAAKGVRGVRRGGRSCRRGHRGVAR